MLILTTESLKNFKMQNERKLKIPETTMADLNPGDQVWVKAETEKKTFVSTVRWCCRKLIWCGWISYISPFCRPPDQRTRTWAGTLAYSTRWGCTRHPMADYTPFLDASALKRGTAAPALLCFCRSSREKYHNQSHALGICCFNGNMVLLLLSVSHSLQLQIESNKPINKRLWVRRTQTVSLRLTHQGVTEVVILEDGTKPEVEKQWCMICQMRRDLISADCPSFVRHRCHKRGYFWKQCPQPYCSFCDITGHKLTECSRRSQLCKLYIFETEESQRLCYDTVTSENQPPFESATFAWSAPRIK